MNLVAAAGKSVGTSDGAAVSGYHQLAAIFSTGRRCIVSGHGSIAAVPFGDIIHRITWLLWLIRECG